ncbi:MAG: RagB/SusD family nutrient uptake outer membrane protein [Paludibacteraceae bacterium]|nr:RagB/SusD family nutrient uptake outer membrane protein [Paludibacteraceae bacterium]
MKSIVKLALIGLVSVSLVSCDSFLNTEPYGQFTAAQLSDESIEGLLASAYAGLEAHYFGNNEAFAGPSTNWIFDVRSDDAYKGGGGVSMEANIHQLEVSNLTSDNVSCLNKWQNNYFAISRVHQAWRGIANSSVENKEALLGELRVLRAWYYFDLIRIFERIPYFTQDDDPNAARYDAYTRDQIFGFIKDDLRQAYNDLPVSQSQAGRFNRYVAAALMAKVSAYTSDWADVATYADYVIGSGQYALYQNYADMSKIEFNNKMESIMAIQFSTANNNAHINWSNLLNTTYSDGNLFGNGDDFFIGSQNLVNAFRTDANGLPYLDDFNEVKVDVATYTGNVDPRLDLTVGRIGMPFRGHTYTLGWCRAYDVYGEYSGKKGLISPESPDMVQGFPWGASGLNFCLIRYADILLLKAEALIEQGTDLETARTLINEVRTKAARSVSATYTPQDLDPTKANYYVAGYPTAGWTQDYARKAVRMERRLELAMEGNRWFDLCRWGVVTEVMNAYYQSESALRPYLAGATMSNDKIFLPLPIDEVRNANGLYGEVGQ